MAELESKKDQLPVVTGELADGWIYGIASDPIKLQRMRELARARRSWVAAGAEAAHPAELARFTLLSTKNSEHTWGIHNAAVTDAALTTGWDNAAFHAARLKAVNPYAAVERAWRQQRSFGIDAAVSSLAGTPLHQDLLSRFASMAPFSPTEGSPVISGAVTPPASGFVPLTTYNRTGVGDWLDLAVDPVTGALIHLAPTRSGAASWASPSHPIALLQYQTLVEADLIAWRAGFLQPWTLTAGMARDCKGPLIPHESRCFLSSTAVPLFF